MKEANSLLSQRNQNGQFSPILNHLFNQLSLFVTFSTIVFGKKERKENDWSPIRLESSIK